MLRVHEHPLRLIGGLVGGLDICDIDCFAAGRPPPLSTEIFVFFLSFFLFSSL